jgi:hypothetical protein
MKKIWCFFCFLILGGAAFAADINNTSIYLEGTAAIPEQLAFFMENFRMEADAAGFEIAENKADAGYIFKFRVEPYTDPSDPRLRYSIYISLILNEDGSEMLSLGWPFASLEEMYEYNQYLFLLVAMNIPKPEIPEQIVEDEGWRNKWLYVRASLDFPITFYALMADGLIAGSGAYFKDENGKVLRVSPVDNKVVALPGMTLGLELQLFKWLSIEPKIQIGWEYLNDKDFVNLAAGLEVKVPLKVVKHIMLEPYGVVVYPLFTPEEIFDTYPIIGFGAGLQLGIKGGAPGIVFLDLSYMYFGDTGIFNSYGELYPEPKIIHYQRSVIGLGIGYKFGYFNRK